MNFPILYTFRRCPYAMRARMALYHAKINYEHREILLKNRPKKLYEISPKGTVPVLDLLNGKVIDESFDIMKWAISMDSSKSLFNRGIIDVFATIADVYSAGTLLIPAIFIF